MVAKYQASMAFPASGGEVFRACLEAVAQCGFRPGEASAETGQITATAGIGMRSWGERIAISVGADGRVEITSACRGIQLVDYGKNKANVTALLTSIGQRLPQQSPPPAF
jgi:hypothetical protein